MIDFEKELEDILATDPLGLLEIKPKAFAITADERLVTSFKEINVFFSEHGKEPTQSRDIKERRLYSRLKGLRDDPGKAFALLEYDTFNLLTDVKLPESVEPKEIKTLEDVLDDDVLGLLDKDDPNDIFNFKHTPKAPKMPDHIAKRKSCKEFDQFEPLFKKTHSELALKNKKMISFSSERQIKPREFFVLQGMLVYVANVGDWEKKNFGNVNARLYCVFENGTESNMLLRSLAAALWKDENSRHIVSAKQTEIFDMTVATGDEATGYIYILRSLSEKTEIKEIENLYKIGFSTQPTAQRVQNAKQEPTYLMADVLVVAEYQTYNLNPQKFENLLHKFFSGSCLNVDVFDNAGKRYTPREWFIASIHIIQTTVQLLISGEIVNYRYNADKQEIEVR